MTGAAAQPERALGVGVKALKGLNFIGRTKQK